MTLLKKPCAKCKKSFRKLHGFRDNFYCYKCYHKKGHIITSPWTIEEALSKTYVPTVRFFNKRRQIEGLIYVPQVLIGKKLRFTIVGDSNVS